LGGGIHKCKYQKLKCKNFEKIISLENLFLAWKEFKKGKRKKVDVQEFEFNLEDNLFQLHRELKDRTYQHSNYTAFSVNDPKPRKIHKAIVRDRVLHHAIFRILYPIFDKGFIFDLYSCRIGKGTRRAVNRLEKFCRKLSRNNTKNIFALKCDIKRFFNSIDQDVLLKIIKHKIKDEDAIWLVDRIIKSFPDMDSRFRGNDRDGRGNDSEKGGNDKNAGRNDNLGLPLGNVTSQLFANIYLDKLDQFIKHKLKIRYYLRYCDDFVILAENRSCFASVIAEIEKFLARELKLFLHPDKIIIRKYHQGIDFLGYVVLPHYRVLRTKTKKRILRKSSINQQKVANGLMSKKSLNQSMQSYLGILKHCCGYKIKKRVVF
jgi:retron-type reverse transcriptase